MSLGIVDTVVARHTKPIDNDDGPFYKSLKSIGVHADQELKKVAEDLRLTSDDLPRVVKRVAGGASPVETTAVSSVTKLRTLYLDTMERMLTGTIYRDPSQEPWSPHEYTDAKRESGRDWPALAHTMIGRKRLHNLRELTERVLAENIPGDLIETGVWRGGACILMAAILHAHDCPDRRVFVADSFEGLPKPDAKYPADQGDIHHTYSELAISLEEVQDNFGRYALLDEKIVFLKGWFKDTLPIAPIEKLAILRLDGDMYESTMDALTNLYSKLSKGGYCIVDDGNIANCQAAVADFRRSYGISDPIIDIDGWGFYWKKT
jgi:O-methyltransferase/8-demethyl-8-(2,3-dimethoxy-alpha-L-rhamnosyl)tetracenomycin-C 4'-O-methyltransferase